MPNSVKPDVEWKTPHAFVSIAEMNSRMMDTSTLEWLKATSIRYSANAAERKFQQY
jgi:hypothetical protein